MKKERFVPFSERDGVTQKPDIQIQSMDARLRNRILSWLADFIEAELGYPTLALHMNQQICDEFLALRMGSRMGQQEAEDQIMAWCHNAGWADIYDLIDFCTGNFENRVSCYGQSGEFTYALRLNNILEQELSGYRLVDNQICQIINEEEIKSIETAVSRKGRWEPASENISKSLESIFHRDKPDFHAGIKYAILAIEKACQIVLGEQCSLGKALKKLEKQGLDIHPSLFEAYSKIYGFTSNEDGIRHSSFKGSSVDLDLAKYFVVSCSAFLNYLIIKSEKFSG